MDYFNMEIPNKQELKPNAFDHLSDIEFRTTKTL